MIRRGLELRGQEESASLHWQCEHVWELIRPAGRWLIDSAGFSRYRLVCAYCGEARPGIIDPADGSLL